MTNLTYKERITQTVIDSLDDSSLTLENAIKSWWTNPMRDRAMRLSSVGDANFRFAKLVYHDHTFNTQTKSYYQFLLELSHKIKCPYYIDVNIENKQPYIRLYDDRISMMLNLYGDLDSYLQSIKVRR
jgi:hypothetical protein